MAPRRYDNVAALVPMSAGDTLPEGWTWHIDDGQVRDHMLDPAIDRVMNGVGWQTTPEPADRVFDHRPEQWTRNVDPTSMAIKAIDRWRSDDTTMTSADAIALVANEERPGFDNARPGAGTAALIDPEGHVTAGDVVGALPHELRGQVMARLGYSPGPIPMTTIPMDAPKPSLAALSGGMVWVTVRVRPADTTGWTHHPEAWKLVPEGFASVSQFGPIYALQRRIARAVAGTPIPAGWRTVEDPDPGIPARFTVGGWQETGSLLSGPPSELTVVTVRRQPNSRWSYGLGTGGHLRIRGEATTQEEATRAGWEAIRADQATAWAELEVKFGVDVLADTPWHSTPPTPIVVVLDPVGAVEIAERLGVARNSVDQWRQRGQMPDPDMTVGGRPAWDWATIERWADDTGRLP